MSQEEVRAEFIEDRVRAQTEHLGDSERKRRMSLFAWDLGFLLKIVV